MHRAPLARSGQLPRVHVLLADGCGHSAHDVVDRARACAANGIVAALRDSGGRVETRRARSLAMDTAVANLYRTTVPASGIR